MRLLLLLLSLTCVRAASSDDSLPFSNETVREWNRAEYPVAGKRGQQALQINPEGWQHLQSAHFVLHFANKGVAIRAAQEAEFYLQTITGAMGMDPLDAGRTSHIFIFERQEDWEQFTKGTAIDPWTGGFFDGLDLFYRRKTGLGVLHSDATLPHEIAHRVLYAKYPSGSIPLALNEGFAEYEARKLAFRYLRPRGYDARYISKRVAPGQFIPAEKLLALRKYPEGEANVVAFYDESERLVNLFVEQNGLPRFRGLLQAMAGGQTFSAALLKHYPADYASLDDFERKFATYAVLEKVK